MATREQIFFSPKLLHFWRVLTLAKMAFNGKMRGSPDLPTFAEPLCEDSPVWPIFAKHFFEDSPDSATFAKGHF
jgi:hypothetical protein